MGKMGNLPNQGKHKWGVCDTTETGCQGRVWEGEKNGTLWSLGNKMIDWHFLAALSPDQVGGNNL